MSSNNENGHNGPLTITMTRESYDVIMETLAMDLDSSYIDEEIKEDIEKAVNDTRIIDSSKSVNPYVKDGNILVSKCCQSEALYRVSEKYGFDMWEFCPQCLELCDWDEIKEEAPTIDPEAMPTCEGCGGQKEHPTKEFSYPPENGLCAMELDECEPHLFDEMSEHYGEHGLPVKCNEDIHGNNIQDLGDYLEGDDCPHCGAEGPEEPDNTDSDVYTIYHNYQCGDCGGKWFLKISHEAFKVVK